MNSAIDLIAGAPFYRFLDLSVVAITETATEAKLRFRDEFIGNPIKRLIHGGIISSAMEASATIHLLNLNIHDPKPINLAIDYLSPARAEDLCIRASTTRLGKTIASLETVSWQINDSNLIAKGLFHFLVT